MKLSTLAAIGLLITAANALAGPGDFAIECPAKGKPHGKAYKDLAWADASGPFRDEVADARVSPSAERLSEFPSLLLSQSRSGVTRYICRWVVKGGTPRNPALEAKDVYFEVPASSSLSCNPRRDSTGYNCRL